MDMLISVGSAAASDAWGFVGTVAVGDVEAYRTMESFATPEEASRRAQQLMAEFVGEVLAGREWRSVRDEHGHTPLREDFRFSALDRRRPPKQPD